MTTGFPVRLQGRMESTPSRALWLVKWLLLVPHVVLLVPLCVTFAVLTVFAWLSILVTGRYPAGAFTFNVGVLRWQWRVSFYGYQALATDRYPPFTLSDVPEYPARLDIQRPEQLSRGLALVKWWLLAIPHYLMIAIFLGGGAGARAGLLGLLVLFAAVLLLFRARYPDGVFDLVLGIDRWVYRVAGYTALMTDRYPPLRLDQGGIDPGGELPPEPLGVLPTSRLLAGVVGGLLVATGIGLTVGGLHQSVPGLWIGGLSGLVAGMAAVLYAGRTAPPADDRGRIE